MCNCKKLKSKKASTVAEPKSSEVPTKSSEQASIVPQIPPRLPSETRAAYFNRLNRATDMLSTAGYSESDVTTIVEALEVNLAQCYLCAKKHIGRAQIFFEEYHTGYSAHAKNLVDSLDAASDEVRKALILKHRVLAHLDMASGELLGNNTGLDYLTHSHVVVANKIRGERLKLQDNPLYIPDFDSLLVDIQMLQYAE